MDNNISSTSSGFSETNSVESDSDSKNDYIKGEKKAEALSIESDADSTGDDLNKKKKMDDLICDSDVDSKSDELSKSNADDAEFNCAFSTNLSQEIIKEEKRLEAINSRAHIKELKELEKEQEQKELTERRYQGLLELLKKSQFYSKYALQKLESSEEAMMSYGRKKNGKKNDKKTFFGISETKEMLSAAKRSKLDSNNDVKTEVEEEGTRVTDLGIVVPESQPKLLTGACLRKYQLEGLDWMRRLYISGLNGILADEMGLGKTVQTIALICSLYENHNTGPFMVVAPLSTLPNWLIEFERFAPDVPVILYHGKEDTRLKLAKKVTKQYNVLNKLVMPVVLTSYEIPIRDTSFFRKYVWKYIIVDEGHRIKNHTSMLARRLKELTSVNRLLLTGTPLQNQLYELWSLLHFLLPEMFQNLEDFSMWFQVEEFKESNDATHVVEKEKNSGILSKLHDIIAPFMLRRLKKEVEINLPPKKELHIYCPLSDMQYALYSWIVDLAIKRKEDTGIKVEDKKVKLLDTKNTKRWCVVSKMSASVIAKARKERQEEEENEMHPSIFRYGRDTFQVKLKMAAPFMVLRKVSNHPYQVQVDSHLFGVAKLVRSSGKMMILDILLRKLKEDNHKVLIFSCFTSMLDIIEDLMDGRNYQYVRLDGNSKIEDRKENIKNFNADPNMFAFLLSTRAGGLGINVPAADTVIFYDSDWNPQADIQAQDRCHRIGQTRPVIVYRLISAGTVDEKIVRRAEAKRKLEKCIIGAGNFGYNRPKVEEDEWMDLQFLKNLIEEKQHESVIKAEGQVLSDEQWQELLNRDF